MSIVFPADEHLHKLWGGPPGPQAHALVGLSRTSKQLVLKARSGSRGTPREPAGPPGGVRPTTYSPARPFLPPGYTSLTARKPMWPVEVSGSVPVRAAFR